MPDTLLCFCDRQSRMVQTADHFACPACGYSASGDADEVRRQVEWERRNRKARKEAKAAGIQHRPPSRHIDIPGRPDVSHKHLSVEINEVKHGGR